MTQPPTPPGPDEPTGPTEPPPPPGGAPAQPPYGAPAPPPYGQAQPPAYGQPPGGPAFPAYGQPGQEQPKGKGLAITSLVLAFIPCLNIVAFVLALVVLIGKKAGKGLAIAALVISVAWAAILVILVLVAGSLFGTPIDDLKTGQCFTADGLTSGDDGVSKIEVVGCSKEHDGEVLAVKTLSSDEADAYKEQSGGEACGPLIDVAIVSALPDDVSVTALTQSEEPDSGDHLACVAFQVDGDKLTEKLG